MTHKDAEKIMRQYCAAHRIKLLYPDSNPDRNEGGQSGRTIWLGEFDDADCLVAAFFHEVGHIIDGRRKFCQNHRVTIFERELRAWTFGLEEMHKFGIGTDAKAIGYMMDRLSRYAAKEAGSGSPEPDLCPTCNHSPIIKIIRYEDGYVGHIECSPESRKICGLLDLGTHIHFDASGPCATPEEAYDAAVETWNGHLDGTLERGARLPLGKGGDHA